MNPLACVASFGFACLMLGGPEALPITDAAAPVVEVSKSQAPAYKPKASEVLLLVQAFYDGTTDLEAKFDQTYFNPTFGAKPTKTRGVLKLKKPGRMVWDYKDKKDPDFFADGKTLWVVEHDTRQVVSRPVEGNSEVSGAMSFLFGGKKLVSEFKVRYASKERTERYGDAKHHVIELKPKKKNPHYKGLALVVHATTGRVDAFVVYNQDGSTNHFTLKGVKTNRGLADKSFNYRVPKGYVETKEG